MADPNYLSHLDTWLDAVFSYGESRRIPVVVVRHGTNLIAIANLGDGLDAELGYSQPLVEKGRGGKIIRRESRRDYGARISRNLERAVIAARRDKIAAFTGRPMAAGRA